MPNSVNYRALKARINELGRNLLPTFSPTGNYSDKQQDRARAYRILVHAEIEAYLEEMALDTLQTSQIDWTNNNRPNNVIISFLAAYHAGWNPDKNGEPFFPLSSRARPKKSIMEAVIIANSQYRTKVINENHGIKAKNLIAMFLPLGIDFDELEAADPTWLANMDNFGERRGLFAHKSKRTQKSIDPKSEYDDVEIIMTGLKSFDERILNLKI